MKGLLLKDFYLSIKYLRAFFFIIVLFLVISCFDSDVTIFIFYPILFSALIPVTLISYDEREKWNIYSATLPYSRAQIVSSKYLVGLIYQSVVLILSIAIQAFRMMSNETLTTNNFLSHILTLIPIALIGPSIILPFVFRYGAEKGRIAYIFVVGILFAVGSVVTGAGLIILPEISDSQGILILFTIAAIAVYITSWGLSVLFYKKREL